MRATMIPLTPGPDLEQLTGCGSVFWDKKLSVSLDRRSSTSSLVMVAAGAADKADVFGNSPFKPRYESD